MFFDVLLYQRNWRRLSCSVALDTRRVARRCGSERGSWGSLDERRLCRNLGARIKIEQVSLLKMARALHLHIALVLCLKAYGVTSHCKDIFNYRSVSFSCSLFHLSFLSLTELDSILFWTIYFENTWQCFIKIILFPNIFLQYFYYCAYVRFRFDDWLINYLTTVIVLNHF